MNNFFRGSIAVLTLLCALALSYCTNDTALLSAEQPLAENVFTDESVEKDVNQLFTALAEAPGLEDMNVAEQLIFLRQYDPATFGEIDQRVATPYHDKGMSEGQQLLETSPLTPFIDQTALIATATSNSGTVLKELNNYRSELLATTDLALNTEELNAVLYNISVTEQLVKNPAVEDYINARNGSTLSARGNQWECFLLSAQIIAYTAACGTANPYACILLAVTIAKFAKTCLKGGDDDYVNPCVNSPNPCCGITCIQGYACNYDTGECEENTSGSGCDDCRPGEECVNGICQPF